MAGSRGEDNGTSRLGTEEPATGGEHAGVGCVKRRKGGGQSAGPNRSGRKVVGHRESIEVSGPRASRGGPRTAAKQGRLLSPFRAACVVSGCVNALLTVLCRPVAFLRASVLSAPSIRMVRADGGDPDAFARFVVEHMAESGRGGSPHFALSRAPIRDEVRSSLIARLLKALDEPLWGRAWVLVEPSLGRFVGHLELRGGRVHAELHRATLGVGCFARTPDVATDVGWLRLPSLGRANKGASSGSISGYSRPTSPRGRLYQRLGFVEIGLRKDAYRIDADVAVDDVLMALKLR